MPFGVFETKLQNVKITSPRRGGMCGCCSRRRALGESWSEEARETQSGSGWGNRFRFFFFLSSSVQPRLKLLQLWTAHQSANRIFCLNRISPPCCEGGAWAVPALQKLGGASHFPVVFVVYALLVFFVCHHVIVLVG